MQHIPTSFGLIGLGVMGRNLVANLAEHGQQVAVCDPWTSVVGAYRDLPPPEGVVVHEGLAGLVAALERPRRILLMVKAGEPVDALCEQLLPMLSPGDILIDGGNSHYRDSERRAEQTVRTGVHFVGLGISGGALGARHGPALMAGCDVDAWTAVVPVLRPIAARAGGEPCCARFGPAGAGHFVKMVHNGIEYALMQILAESYDLLRRLAGLDEPAIAELFNRWNDGEHGAYLLEISARVLGTRDPDDGTPLLAKVADSGQQKGTGRWTVEAGLALGVPLPTIGEAVFARALAALREERRAAAGEPVRPLDAGDRDALIAAVGDALLGASITAYAQGFALIRAASDEYGWDIDPASVAHTWRSGCIIRARQLDRMIGAFEAAPGLTNLLLDPSLAARLDALDAGWRHAVGVATARGVPLPATGSALAYRDGYRTARLPANLVQAQRDCFGAHGYQRIDRAGTFHSNWGAG